MIYYRLTKVYRSTGLILVSPFVSQILCDAEQSRVLPMFNVFVNSQIELIRSGYLIDTALEDESRRRGRTLEPARFREHLDVTRLPDTNLIAVSYEDPDPKAAQAAVAAVIKAYEQAFDEQDAVFRNNALMTLLERRQSATLQAEELSQRMLQIAGGLATDGIEKMQQLKIEELHKYEMAIKDTRLMLVEQRLDAPTQNGDAEPTQLEPLQLRMKTLRQFQDEVKAALKELARNRQMLDILENEAALDRRRLNEIRTQIMQLTTELRPFSLHIISFGDEPS